MNSTYTNAFRARIEHPENLWMKEAKKLAWARMPQLAVPVMDHWWQTDSGWTMRGQCLKYGAQPVQPGSANFPIPAATFRSLGPMANGRNHLPFERN